MFKDKVLLVAVVRPLLMMMLLLPPATVSVVNALLLTVSVPKLLTVAEVIVPAAVALL